MIQNRKCYILVVDDDSMVRDLLQKSLLELFDARDSVRPVFVHAEDGTEAMRKMRNQEFSLIIVDINMPKASGFELVRWAAKTLNQKVRLILISGEMTRIDVDEALELGISNILVKPFNHEDLLLTAKKALQGPPIRLRAS